MSRLDHITSLKIEVPSQKGLGNNTVVRRTGGYGKEQRETPLPLTLQTFLFYLRYRASRNVNTDEFVYNMEDEYLWKDIGISSKTFTNKLKDLVDEGILERTAGMRKVVTYKIVSACSEELKIPLGILLNRRLDWEIKIKLFKMFKAAVENGGELFLPILSKNSKEPITGIRYGNLKDIAGALNDTSLLEHRNGNAVINFLYILGEISGDTIFDMDEELAATRKELKKLEEKNSLLEQLLTMHKNEQ